MFVCVCVCACEWKLLSKHHRFAQISALCPVIVFPFPRRYPMQLEIDAVLLKWKRAAACSLVYELCVERLRPLNVRLSNIAHSASCTLAWLNVRDECLRCSARVLMMSKQLRVHHRFVQMPFCSNGRGRQRVRWYMSFA